MRKLTRSRLSKSRVDLSFQEQKPKTNWKNTEPQNDEPAERPQVEPHTEGQDVTMAKSVKAKKSALGNGDDLVIAPLRPINPFIAGIGLAAGWSALHVPHLISLTVIATFSVESIAIAVISGGVLAVTMELMFVVANKISSRLKKIIRMVR